MRYQIQLNSIETGKWKPVTPMYQVSSDDSLDICVDKTKNLIREYGGLSPIRLFDTEEKKAVELWN